MTLSTFLRAFWFGAVLLRCPVCRKGSLYRSPFSFRLLERCPSCGVRFMPDRGEVAGGMAINMVLTSILGVVCVIYVAVFTKWPPVYAVAALVFVPTLFALWFHRRANGLWVATLHLTRNMDEPHPLARTRTRTPQ
jgi:uncharacterized protein (DUF983 family)